MRRTISISVSEEMHEYILRQCSFGSVSEYFRSLVRDEKRRREDYAARPVAMPSRANDHMAFGEALGHLEKLKAILERRGLYDD